MNVPMDFTLMPTGIIGIFGKTGILNTILMSVMGYNLNELITEIFNNIFKPILNCNDKKGVKLEDKYVEIGKYKFNYGKISLIIAKLIVAMYIVYTIMMFIKYITP